MKTGTKYYTKAEEENLLKVVDVACARIDLCTGDAVECGKVAYNVYVSSCGALYTARLARGISDKASSIAKEYMRRMLLPQRTDGKKKNKENGSKLHSEKNAQKVLNLTRFSVNVRAYSDTLREEENQKAAEVAKEALVIEKQKAAKAAATKEAKTPTKEPTITLTEKELENIIASGVRLALQTKKPTQVEVNGQQELSLTSNKPNGAAI